MFVLLKFFYVIMSLQMVLLSPLNTKFGEIEKDQNQNEIFFIIGGYRPLKHTLAKYIVSIRHGNLRFVPGDNHLCGGSILYPKVVLTAAHCAVDTGYNYFKNLSVVAGTPYLFQKIDSEKTYKVVKMLIHPAFDYSEVTSDIALLHLEKEVEQDGETISLVPLVDEKPHDDTKCIAYGWGHVFQKGPRPIELVYVNLTLFPRYKCRQYSPRNPTAICAGNKNDLGKGVFSGDSGGPLLCNGKLAGVSSFVFPYMAAPDFFTNVYKFHNWIEKNCGNHLNLCNLIVLFNLAYIFFEE